MTKKKTLFLFDGSAMFYRAYFAFIRNPLINSKGENTSAVFGFVNSLLKVIREENPDYMAVIFDTKEPTFRHDMYDQYKANRDKMPEDLADQIPHIHEAINAMNIPHISMVGYEADDIIGTYSVKGEEAGLNVFVVTGDKDCFQLVTDNVSIYNLNSKTDSAVKMGPDEVELKFGVRPEQVIDKLALMGDSSDNIPGIPGVGPKSADALLQQFGSFEDILTRFPEIKAKGLRTKVESNIEKARLSLKLVTIDLDVPVKFDLESMKKQPVDVDASTLLFKELELNRLLKQVLGSSSQEEITNEEPDNEVPTAPRGFYHTVKTINDLKKLVKEMSKCKEIAVDTETTSLNTIQAQLVGVSLSDKAGVGYYIPIGHSVLGDNNLPQDEALEIIKPLLENSKVQKCGQNIKFDLQVLHNYGIDIKPISFDTMLASYVIDPSTRAHSLDALAKKHFNHQMQPISDLIGKGKNQKSFALVPIEQATPYAGEDADFTFRLRGALAPKLESGDLYNVYYNIELPLIKVLSDMEETGVNIDATFLGKLSSKMSVKLDKIMKEIYEIAGVEFNINSTQQLGHILFDKLNLPAKKKTAKKTGYSTDVKVLEDLAPMHPLPKLVLNYRQFTKLKSTYIDALPKLIEKKTGRVHTSFNQTIAATGRLSSTDPNLQNIPIRTDEGREIRRAFIPRDKDHFIMAADYSQIELRILAHYAEDPVLIKAYKNAEDIHARTAAEVYSVKIDDVTPEMRRAAKTANFAIIYGVSAFGLAQQSELSLSESKEFIEKYFVTYPGIQAHMEATKEFAREHGFVVTMYNRRRYIPDINSKNRTVKQFAERIAINTPIQGTAADLIKLAMLKIDKKMSGMKSKMIMQVHDELVFDAHKSEREELREIVKDGMEKVVKLKVPLIADIGEGENWLDAK